MSILQVQHIEKHFGDTRVLEDISFELEQVSGPLGWDEDCTWM